MRFEIAVHAQRGGMRSDLPQQPTLDEKPEIVVDRGEGNGWNAAPNRGVNIFRGMVPVGGNDGLIDHLTLVRDRQTVLRGQLTKLFMGEAHDYRMRMIIKRSRAVSTENFPLTSNKAGRRNLAANLLHRDFILEVVGIEWIQSSVGGFRLGIHEIYERWFGGTWQRDVVSIVICHPIHLP
jgi:hypothetical protein